MKNPNPMTKVVTKNALIEDISLGIEHHNVITCSLYLEYGGGSECQCFGGWNLEFKDAKGKNGIDYIRGILETVGVEKWEDLKGKNIRVKASLSNVEAIGHITKDNWFNPKELFTNDNE